MCPWLRRFGTCRRRRLRTVTSEASVSRERKVEVNRLQEDTKLPPFAEPTNFKPTLFGANSTSCTLPFESANLALSAHLFPLLFGSPSHSSQIFTVLSKLHDTNACPNSGCAHETFRMDESCAFQESFKVQDPVPSSRSQTLMRWSDEQVMIRLPYQSVAMSWIRSSCCAEN